MSAPIMQHRTTAIEKTLKASPERVFDAWADSSKRVKWNSPSSDIEIRMEADGFSVGGRDISDCLIGGETVARVIADYHDIVPSKRIVFSESIHEGEACMGVSLVSVELQSRGSETLMTVTLQSIAFDGSSLLDDVIVGWEAALQNLTDLCANLK